MLAASVTLLVASDHEHRAFLHPSEAARRCTGGVVTMARLSSFLARQPRDSSPRGVAHLVRAHRHPLHRPRRPHATLQRARRGPPTPGHATGCQPRQRHPRRSLSSTRPSAPSSPSVNPRRGRGSRGTREPWEHPANPGSTRRTLGAPGEPWQHPANPGSTRRTLGAPGECATHPHGSPQMSHVIPLPIIQTLKYDRCNSNVFWTYRKLTKRNYVRIFGEERLPLATTPPSHRWGLPTANRTPSTHASGQPGVNDRTSDQASHVGR